MAKQKTSLRTGFLSMIVICWLVPLVIVVVLAGVLLGRSYQQSARQVLNADAEYAIQQVHFHLEEAVYASKSVSYDGVIRNAYRNYQETGDSVALYATVNDYLTRNFSRNQQSKAVFVCFWDETLDADVYQLNSGITSYGLLENCRADAPQILSGMKDAGTDVSCVILNGNLYLARNLLNSHFKPYASVVMMLDPNVIFQSLNGLSRASDIQMCIDDTAFSLDDQGNVLTSGQCCDKNGDLHYSVEHNGHTFSFSASISKYHVWKENPWLYAAVFAVALMVLPLLIVVVVLFRKHVTLPMETLEKAHQLVESGNRGYEITEDAPNAEFGKMYDQFNATSTELKNQFERSYLEQQASQRAQIKALQSQINPHFLNNTLEIINWEARLADNTRVSAMIEALSTMLGAALDRKGRPQIPLSEELGYVDAYLYIIGERLGDGFHVHKQIAPDTLPKMIPRLILQPIVENAVEHDISDHHGGNLWVRTYIQNGQMVLEVEHDGTMNQTDRENIQMLLSDQGQGSHVGLRNVHQRLKLIYGSQGILKIEETSNGTILVSICFPVDSAQSEGGETR